MYRTAAVALSMLILSGLAVPALAACPPTFPPSDFHVMPDDDVQAFVTYSEPDRIQTLVVQPTFSGTATEFGMVMPVPNRPEISKAPEDMFEELWEYTGSPIVEHSAVVEGNAFQSSSSSVVVLEQKAVGDFETTLLTAENSRDLVDWLNSHDFQFVREDEANFDYYVQKGGYYFVAMKVNMDEADIGEDGTIDGKLRPIEFTFKSEQPMLPFRIMAHDMDEMSFTLYTLGSIPYYIPGVTVTYVGRVPDWAGAGPGSLERYDPVNKWLLKMHVDFDPRTIERNLILQRVGDYDFLMSKPFLDPVLNPHLSSPDSGIVIATKLSDADMKILTRAAQIVLDVSPSDAKCEDIRQTMLMPSGRGPVCIEESDRHEYVEKGWIAVGDLAEANSVTQSLLGEIIVFPTFPYSVTPLEQASLGIPSGSIECKSAMELVLRPGGSACVSKSSADILVERGWERSTMMANELERLS